MSRGSRFLVDQPFHVRIVWIGGDEGSRHTQGSSSQTIEVRKIIVAIVSRKGRGDGRDRDTKKFAQIVPIPSARNPFVENRDDPVEEGAIVGIVSKLGKDRTT